MLPLRLIGVLCCGQAPVGTEAMVTPETAVLMRLRRDTVVIADRVYRRILNLGTPSELPARSERVGNLSSVAPSMGATEGSPMRRLFLICSLLMCSPVFAQDAMFRGNAEHTGVYSGAGVPQFSKIKWQFHTDGQVLSSPAVTADTVYV